MTTSRPAPPPYDAELAAALETTPFTPSRTVEMIEELRAGQPILQEVLPPSVAHREIEIPGYQGHTMLVSVFTPHDHTPGAPGILYIHGGGMVSGNRLSGIDQVLTWVERFRIVCVSVDYRLAPEHPDPIPVEDCYAALVWTAANAGSLGIDHDRLIIAGMSAGGGLAAGATLLARDRRGPSLLGQVLMCPMLDDRNDTVAARQFDGSGGWDRTSNTMGWTALLGSRRGTDDVSVYAAPSRATDLSGLPPSLIDVGSAEVFRDEDVAYATRIWECGGAAELHVWPGGFHSFELVAPDAAMSRDAVAARDHWIARLLGEPDPAPA